MSGGGFGPYGIYMKWQSVEMLGYCYFSEKGYRICVPLVQGDGYDFIAEKDGETIRVNVKLAGLKDKTSPNSWSIAQASGSLPNMSRRNKISCDVFLAYIPEPYCKFVELNGDFFDGNSKSKRIPPDIYIP
jgi:hypothetical protein